MRHYEIVLLIHPDQSDQVPSMIKRYERSIQDGGGSVDRREDWGRRQLAYPINKLYKAHYVLLNITCDHAVVKALGSKFSHNDSVIRHLIVRRDRMHTEPSPMVADE